MELSGLQKFARQLLIASSEGCDFCGDEIQGLAEEHGLCTKEPYDPTKHKNISNDGYLAPGDTIYVFNDVLEGGK